MTTRTILNLPQNWDTDESSEGYGDPKVYSRRVREWFDRGLDKLDNGTYRSGDEIHAPIDSEGMESDQMHNLLEEAHDYAIAQAESDAAAAE